MHRAPGIPHALTFFWGGMIDAQLGRIRAAGMRKCDSRSSFLPRNEMLSLPILRDAHSSGLIRMRSWYSVRIQTLMVRRRAAPSRTMLPDCCLKIEVDAPNACGTFHVIIREWRMRMIQYARGVADQSRRPWRGDERDCAHAGIPHAPGMTRVVFACDNRAVFARSNATKQSTFLVSTMDCFACARNDAQNGGSVIARSASDEAIHVSRELQDGLRRWRSQ